MPSLRESLVVLLVGEDEQAAKTAEELSKREQWPEMVSLGAAWRAVSHLHHRLASLEIQLPEPALATLRQFFRKTFACSATRARSGLSVLALLERHGVPAVAFKGLASMALLYGPQRRAIQDVDILVGSDDLEPALSVLEASGYSLTIPGDPRDHVSFVRNAPGIVLDNALPLVDKNHCDIDLHWGLGTAAAPEFRSHRIVARRMQGELFGTPFNVVSPPDALLLSVHHAVKNACTPDNIAWDLVDSNSWLHLLDSKGQLQTAVEHAQSCELAVQLLAILLILARYNNRGPAALALSMLEPRLSGEQIRSARALVDLFLLQLERGSLNRDLLDLFYVTYPVSFRQLAKTLVWRARRFRKFGGAQRPVRERLGDLYRSLFRLQRSHISLVKNLTRLGVR